MNLKTVIYGGERRGLGRSYYRFVGRNLRERRQSSCPAGKWHSFELLGNGFSRRLDRGWDVGRGGELLSPVGPAPVCSLASSWLWHIPEDRLQADLLVEGKRE